MRWLYGILMAVGLASTASATPGKVDAEGCHQSAKAGHHCHAERAARGQSSGSMESPQARDRRLLRECKGRPNAGACLGYANAHQNRR